MAIRIFADIFAFPGTIGDLSDGESDLGHDLGDSLSDIAAAKKHKRSMRKTARARLVMEDCTMLELTFLISSMQNGAE